MRINYLELVNLLQIHICFMNITLFQFEQKQRVKMIHLQKTQNILRFLILIVEISSMKFPKISSKLLLFSVMKASTQEVIIDPKDEMLRLEVNEGLKDDDDASIPSIPVHGDETVSTTADVREDGQKQGKGSLPDHQEISMPSVEAENIPQPDFDGIEDNEVKRVKSAEEVRVK